MTEHTEITEQTENDFFIVDCDLMSDAHTPTRSVHNLWAQIRVHSWLIFSVISVISGAPGQAWLIWLGEMSQPCSCPFDR